MPRWHVKLTMRHTEQDGNRLDKGSTCSPIPAHDPPSTYFMVGTGMDLRKTRTRQRSAEDDRMLTRRSANPLIYSLYYRRAPFRNPLAPFEPKIHDSHTIRLDFAVGLSKRNPIRPAHRTPFGSAYIAVVPSDGVFALLLSWVAG